MVVGSWNRELPAGVDEVGVGEVPAVGLRSVPVLFVQLGPAVRVVEVGVRQVPQGVAGLHRDRGHRRLDLGRLRLVRG
jgi:hypothetical protein